MSIHFVCLSCGRRLLTKDHLGGKLSRCPACRAPVVVPAPAGEAADSASGSKAWIQWGLNGPSIQLVNSTGNTGPMKHSEAPAGPIDVAVTRPDSAQPGTAATVPAVAPGVLSTPAKVMRFYRLHPAVWASGGGGAVAVLALAVVLILNRGGKPEAHNAHELADTEKALAPGAPSADAIFAKASPSVVRIEMQDRASRPLRQGSGFVVSENGVIATNYHVIQRADSGSVIFDEGSTYAIVAVAGIDLDSDLALLAIQRYTLEEWKKARQARRAAESNGAFVTPLAPRKFPALVLAGTDQPPIGTKVYAIGAPLGLTNTLSEGLLSGRREVSSSLTLLQTSAPISHGSSGGPLLSADGRVLGITSLSFSEGQNLNFAVPVQRLAKLIAAHSQEMTLADAGSRGADQSQERPTEAPATLKPISWTSEEKENLAHFFRALKWEQSAKKGLDRPALTITDLGVSSTLFDCGIDEADAVKADVLTKVHPDLPAVFKEKYIRSLRLNSLYLQSSVARANPYPGLHNERENEISRLEDAIFDLESRGTSNASEFQRQWLEWWASNGKKVRFPDEVPVLPGEGFDDGWASLLKDVRFPKFVPK